MDLSVVATCILIFFARITDVSLGTLRTVAIIRGMRGVAWGLGFVEVLIWIVAVSKVIQNLDHLAYALAFALGFATGNYVGLMIEQWLSIGRQAVRLFSRRGLELAASLRQEGIRVTQFEGLGKDGPVWLLYCETQRRRAPRIVRTARGVDPACFYVIDDIRSSSSPPPPMATLGPLGRLGGMMKRK